MAVPLPAGRPVPSGRMAMSHALMSGSEIGLPRPGVSATAAGAVQANAIASRSLRVDMLDLPVAVDAPARRAVVVLVGERKRAAHRRLGLAAGGDHDPRYAADAGIGDAGNFVIARPLQRVAE